MPDEVGQHRAVGILDDGALGHGQDEVGTVTTVALVARTGLAVGGLAVRRVVVVEQRGGLRVDGEDDRATAPAVAAVGATERLELLTLDRCDAVAAVSCSDVQHDAIDEGRHACAPDKRVVMVLDGCREGRASTGPPLKRRG